MEDGELNDGVRALALMLERRNLESWRLSWGIALFTSSLTILSPIDFLEHSFVYVSFGLAMIPAIFTFNRMTKINQILSEISGANPESFLWARDNAELVRKKKHLDW